MLVVTLECLRVSKGAVVWVLGSVTRDRNYWPAPEGLMYRWWQEGGSMYRPCYWRRVGIFGSGGDQWFRADVEYACCFKRAGPLPWTDNTACGHTPKWAPGGEMSHRLSDGSRVNQWGHSFDSGGTTTHRDGRMRRTGPRPSHRRPTSQSERQRTGKIWKPSEGQHGYAPPAKANPGTLLSGNVGGGHMGHPYAHSNEAPFPEYLAYRFVLSLCPPGGIILDPFSGSGSTVAVAKKNGRIGIGMDIRFNQCELARRRILNPNPETPIPDAAGQEVMAFGET